MDGDEYREHLTGLGLDALLAEPSALQTQAHHLSSSLSALTLSSYPTFLQLHSSTSALSSSLTSLSSSLDGLLTTTLPALDAATAAWRTRTDTVLHERNKARVVLEQHDKIRDLLDIPVLIDTCVRNGYFSEALSLVNHADALMAPSKIDHTPLLLRSLHAELHHSKTQMLLTLLATLHEPHRKLPALWKAVGFLRKMDALGQGWSQSLDVHSTEQDRAEKVDGEELLALAFLSGRLACLEATLHPIARDIHRLVDGTPITSTTTVTATYIPDSRNLTDRDQEDVARHLKKYIDAWREGITDIITQYSAIFLEPSPSHTSASAKSTPKPTPPQHLLPPLTTHLLNTHLLPLIDTALPRLSPPLLPALLTQLTYAAAACTRAGLDFRPLVGAAVERAVTIAVSRELGQAARAFVDGLKGRTTAAAGGGSVKPPGKKTPLEWMIVPALADAPPTPPRAHHHSHASSPAHLPPPLLASFPPLAVYTNALLGVLNGLRAVAPVGVAEAVAGAVEEVLKEGGRAVGEAVKVWASAWDGGDGEGEGDESVQGQEEAKEDEREAAVARAFGDAYFGVLVPFVRRAIREGVYGIREADGWA